VSANTHHWLLKSDKKPSLVLSDLFLTRLHTQCPTDILTMSIVDVLFAAESNDHVEFIEAMHFCA